jgi:hypothetical protein
MTVRLILQFLGKSGIVLFEGLSSECPPILACPIFRTSEIVSVARKVS